MSSIIVLGMLVLAILIHEMGHYWACRMVGVPIEEVSIGFGHPLLRYSHNGTIWSLRAIPLGGYVRRAPDDLLNPLSSRKNIFIILAGPFFNLIPLLALAAASLHFGEVLLYVITVYGKLLLGAVLTLLKPLSIFITFPPNLSINLAPIFVASPQVTEMLSSRSIWYTLGVAFISVNASIGIANLLPLYPLDGGHVVTQCLTGIFGRRVAKFNMWFRLITLFVTAYLIVIVLGSVILRLF